MKGRSVLYKMAEGEYLEKLSIRDSVKSLKKYGSTSTHIKRQENLIKHSIAPSDTLQGIALKYGVTTEQIRRVNRLWATDSLFLREYLLIPVATDSPLSPIESSFGNSNNNSNKSVVSDNDEEPTIDSFLSNIDSSIANMKKEVKKAQGNSEFARDMDIDPSIYQKKHAISRMRQSTTNKPHHNNSTRMTSPPDILSNTLHYQQQSSSATSYQQSEPQKLPMVITQTGRKLRTSLQRLEQQQDEMFEL